MLCRLMLVLFSLAFLAGQASAQVRVKGYYRKDGTYVAPHYRSSPNSSATDNYSSRGNYNPYTGKPGTVDPYKTPITSPTYRVPYQYRPPVVPPSPTGNGWWDDEPVSPDAVETARSEVSRLQEEWEATDPFYAQRIEVLNNRLASVAALPPGQWAATLEREYWAIPATKGPQVLAERRATGPGACDSTEWARSNLQDAARRLAQCAEDGDDANHCQYEAGQVRFAAQYYAGLSSGEACR